MIPVIGDFSLLSPQGLWLLAALAIPILIHLFSRSKGKHVLIGSIELIRQARKERVREVRLSQWLLLLLRLLIVAVLALLLADLVRLGLEDRKEDTAYVTPQWLSASSAQDQALLLAGHPQNLFLLAEGLPEINSETIESVPGETDSSRDVSAWAHLSEALATINHQGAVTVYATYLAGDWPATKLDLPREVEWSLVEGQSEFNADSIEALIVFDRDRAGDARRMELAMEVLSQHRVPNLTWSSAIVEQAGAMTERPDWLVWLSDQPITSEFNDPGGTPITILTDQSLSPGQSPESLAQTSVFANTQISVHALHSDLNLPGAAVLWEMEDGRPLLTRVHSGATRTINFASRFNTDWTDLQLQAGFPETLWQIMQDEGDQFSAYPATIEYSQEVVSDTDSGDLRLPSRSMQMWLAMLLTMLWIAERWLSERQRHA